METTESEIERATHGITKCVRVPNHHNLGRAIWCLERSLQGQPRIAMAGCPCDLPCGVQACASKRLRWRTCRRPLSAIAVHKSVRGGRWLACRRDAILTMCSVGRPSPCRRPSCPRSPRRGQTGPEDPNGLASRAQKLEQCRPPKRARAGPTEQERQ